MKKKNLTTISKRFLNVRLDEEPNLSLFAKNLSENELKGKSFTAIRQAIMKVENGDQTMPPLYLIEAYCKHFNYVTSDYLLGIRDVSTTDEDVAMICKYTGLSEEAVERISKYDNNKKDILNSLICDDNSYDLLYLLLTSLYLYGMNVNNADITIRDRSLDTTTQITDNETIKRMLKYDTAESFDFCLNHVAKMYKPVIEENLKRTIELKEKETMLQLIKDGYSPKEAQEKLDEIKKGSDIK